MKKLSKKEWIAAGVAVVFIGYMFFGSDVAGTFNSAINGGQNASAVNTQTASVSSQDEILGTGPVVEKGMQVSVNYVLKLTDGTVIQDSKEVNSGKPVSFVAGGQNSWEIGILGMRVGGKRLIIIPPELAYGSQQVGPIPPNSTLIFEIEVVSAVPAGIPQ